MKIEQRSNKSRARGYKTFFSFSTQLSRKFILLINIILLITANSFLLIIALRENLSANKFVGIFIFIGKGNFMLSWVEHEICFIISGLVIVLFCFWSAAYFPDDHSFQIFFSSLTFKSKWYECVDCKCRAHIINAWGWHGEAWLLRSCFSLKII